MNARKPNHLTPKRLHKVRDGLWIDLDAITLLRVVETKADDHPSEFVGWATTGQHTHVELRRFASDAEAVEFIDQLGAEAIQ